MLRRVPLLLKKKNKNCRKQDFKGGWEDTQQRNLNSKYLNVTLVKYPDSYICFYYVQYAFTRKVRFYTTARSLSKRS